MLKDLKVYDTGKVKVCNNNTCIEADGKNAQAIIQAIVFLVICISAYYLSNIK